MGGVTPPLDKSGNYSKGATKPPVGNNDRCSLLKCVSPMSLKLVQEFNLAQWILSRPINPRLDKGA